MSPSLDAGRLPPGQRLVNRMPVLHYGPVPRVNLERWELRLFGRVEEERAWTYPALRNLPARTFTCDIHCVTGWSMLDTTWEGIPVHDLLADVRLGPEATFALVHAENGFTTNLPLEVLTARDTFLAWGYEGQDLPPEHGWPLRLVVPSRYFWKSAKWVTGIEFLDHQVLGFWERRGYHADGDPWKEERYGGFR